MFVEKDITGLVYSQNMTQNSKYQDGTSID